jgi:hypothetical protein
MHKHTVDQSRLWCRLGSTFRRAGASPVADERVRDKSGIRYIRGARIA